MKLKILFVIIILLPAVVTHGQQNVCADSSIRLKYIFGTNGARFFNNPDTIGNNIFTGTFVEGLTGGMALMKTTWGDSIIWAKKVYMTGTSLNSFTGPNGTFICTGSWKPPGNNKIELLISRIDTNGIIQWIKRYSLSQNHLRYNQGNFDTKNITVANNAIYVNCRFNDYYTVIAKLGLDGNIIWSQFFIVNFPNSSGDINAPAFYNNSVLFASGITEGIGCTSSSKIYNTITKLNDADGSLMEANSYKSSNNSIALSNRHFNANADNSFSFTGFMGAIDFNGCFSITDNMFNSRIDANLNVLHNYYYTNNVNAAYEQEAYFDFNHLNQHAVLSENTPYDPSAKYFVTFDKNDAVLRSRKFVIPSIFTFYRNSVNLDDKQNLHFLYHYDQGTKIITEYARISNLAPNSTLSCVGKDTSIFTPVPFTLTKEPFVWDNVQSDIITSNDVPYTEDTAIVTKELVCKIVSLCNNIKINGPAAACMGVPVRYTVSKNNGCFKNLDWFIDTTAASIISTEGDSAITLQFKKTFTGYIRAALTDCVVKDSFLVTTVVPKMPPLINRKDSLLCPGKTLTLTANAGYTNYFWQNNTVGQQFTVNSTGVYTITALDSCGATRTDSIRVTLADTTLVIPATQTVCLYDTAFITLPNDVNNITWQPSGNSLLNNKTLLLYPQQTTVYTINAGRSLNCTTIKTTTVVIKNCPQTVFIPNSFTPNNDTYNDIFKPIISQPLAFYRFAIYNRYGQTIFETSNQQSGWEGTFKGTRQPQGGYIYQCSYRFAGTAVQKNVNGYFLLLR
jgi:gliding motility-associated-like protein